MRYRLIKFSLIQFLELHCVCCFFNLYFFFEKCVLFIDVWIWKLDSWWFLNTVGFTVQLEMRFFGWCAFWQFRGSRDLICICCLRSLAKGLIKFVIYKDQLLHLPSLVQLFASFIANVFLSIPEIPVNSQIRT